MTVCLVSPAMVESTAGVAAVRLLSSFSEYAAVVSGLPSALPIVDSAIDPTIQLATLLAISLTFPATLPAICLAISCWKLSLPVTLPAIIYGRLFRVDMAKKFLLILYLHTLLFYEVWGQ